MKIEECTAPTSVDRRPPRTLIPASPAVIRNKLRKAYEDSNTVSGSSRCGLLQCRKLECNLNSHRQFAGLRRRTYLKRSQNAETTLIAFRQQPSNGVLDHSVSRIERQIADGFPALPLGVKGSSIFRELVRHYFTCQIDRLIQIYSPHLDRYKYKSTMMDHALSNDVFCICITANAKTDMLMRGHVRTPDRSSEIVYGMTAKVLREKLNDFRPTDTDWLLVLVVALVGFDLAFDRTAALQAHHNALRHLTAMKGGIHAVGHVLPYVLNTDRFLAIFTGQYPIFKQTPLLPPTPRHSISSGPYGRAFREPDVADYIDRPVLDFCLQQCQTIHLMETLHISLVPHTTPASDPSAIPYFLYLRDKASCEGTCLYAYYHENRILKKKSKANDLCEEQNLNMPALSMSRCVLLAAMIVEYAVAHGNYYTIKMPFLAERLKSVLEQLPASERDRHGDMVLWLLSVLAVLPERWEHHQWALSLLAQRLDIRYEGRWPQAEWRNDHLALLKGYIWSERLDLAFRKVCIELVTEHNQ